MKPLVHKASQIFWGGGYFTTGISQKGGKRWVKLVSADLRERRSEAV